LTRLTLVFSCYTMNESQRAHEWRKRNRLTRQRLGELTGYSPLAIYWMERGLSARGTPIWPAIWRRYKMACAAAQASLKGQEFDWS
jgi:hypothetical protein